jgi:hypothetical protein
MTRTPKQTSPQSRRVSELKAGAEEAVMSGTSGSRDSEVAGRSERSAFARRGIGALPASSRIVLTVYFASVLCPPPHVFR